MKLTPLLLVKGSHRATFGNMLRTTGIWTFTLVCGLQSNAQVSSAALASDLIGGLEPVTTPGDTAAMVSEGVLNALFNLQTGRYLAGTGDLTYAKGFAILDNADDRLSIGGQIATANKPTERVVMVFSGSIKANIKKNFATAFKGPVEQNDLGVGFKVTFIGRGILNYTQAEDKYRKDYRMLLELEKRKSLAEVSAWVDADQKARGNDLPFDAADYEGKKEEAQAALARKLAKSIMDKRLYHFTYNHWVSLEGYVPLTPINYYTLDSLTSATWRTHEMRPYELRLNWTHLLQNRYTGTTFLTVGLGYVLNNNVLSQQLKSYSATNNIGVVNADTLALVQLDGQSAGLGAYEEFNTLKALGRFVQMFTPFMGVSAEVEFWMGDYSPINWKLGVPFSFKNEKGERSINFELQWRELMEQHSIGVSVGLPIGGPLYK